MLEEVPLAAAATGEKTRRKMQRISRSGGERAENEEVERNREKELKRNKEMN